VRNLRYLNTLPSSSTLLEAVSGMLEVCHLLSFVFPPLIFSNRQCYLVLDERRLKDDVRFRIFVKILHFALSQLQILQILFHSDVVFLVISHFFWGGCELV